MIRSLLLAAGLLGCSSLALGQGRVEKYPELGLTLTRPPRYEQLPVRPRERFCVLSYVEELEPAARAAGRQPATLDVYLVPRDGGAGEAVTDAESFLARELVPDSKRLERTPRRRFEYQPRRWSCQKVVEGRPTALWVHAWEGPLRTYVIVGRSDLAGLDDQRVYWERSAEGLRLFDPRQVDQERKQLERYYKGKRISGVDHRIDVRLGLVDGWKARDSEHFIVLSHEVDERFLVELIDSVETIRGVFLDTCPPDHTVDVVSTIRVCRDEAEYLAYGGWQGSVGYWSAGEEELVLFDASGLKEGGIDGAHYTQAVLLHEAFHQYIHYAADEVAPHPWFDEGMAEYFGGAVIDRGRVGKIEPNRYRLESAQEALREGHTYPWEVVTGLDREQFYADSATLYPQAWSMVHFLATSPQVRRDRRWSEILPTYFRTLRGAWNAERRRLTGGGSVEDARARARRRAAEAAFAGVDWGELEEAWARHLEGLRLPRAR